MDKPLVAHPERFAGQDDHLVNSLTSVSMVEDVTVRTGT